MSVQGGECLLVSRLHGLDEQRLIMQIDIWQAATIRLTGIKNNKK
jgi:hypothetical protein